ncbi:DUF2510 domain-containing protein [Actinoplanes sp. NPDC023936]|uniref:DUF2510 domain-containing protein n=1 Tax=Actinoplanes sp. NPDC023936 TaxID=3154910 RepID=UPI0033CB9CCA
MSSPAQPSGAPAGWYPDPHGLPALRWWDGREWTAHIQPGADVVPPGTHTSGPAGDPWPGAHTTVPARAFIPAGGHTMQPVDAVSAQLGYTTPVTPHGPPLPDSPDSPVWPGLPLDDADPRAGSAKNRAVIVGAVSLLINPLLLCSILAIVLGVRGLTDSRRTGTLAIVLGATGVLTHIAFVVLLNHLL